MLVFFWFITAVIALYSVWLYRKNRPALCAVMATVPAGGATALFLILLHDLNLPHGDGIPVTAVMRWFMLSDNPTLHEDRAISNAAVLLAAAALFCAVMLILILLKRRKKA